LPTGHPKIPSWLKEGWIPFLVSRVNVTGCGFQIEGNELRSDGQTWPRRLIQRSIDASFRESKGCLEFGYLLAMNGDRLLSVLHENVVLLRWKSDSLVEVSTIAITGDNEIIVYFFELGVA
jgi:hypothetical protein